MTKIINSNFNEPGVSDIIIDNTQDYFLENFADITPPDSVVPVYLSPHTKEQEADFEEYNKLQKENADLALKVKKSAIDKLKAIGLTEEEAKAIAGL